MNKKDSKNTKTSFEKACTRSTVTYWPKDNCNCCLRYRMVDKTGICFDCWKNPNCDKE